MSEVSNDSLFAAGGADTMADPTMDILSLGLTDGSTIPSGGGSSQETPEE